MEGPPNVAKAVKTHTQKGIHATFQSSLHPGWVIRSWQDNLESPYWCFWTVSGPRNPHRQEQNLWPPHRKETVHILLTVYYVNWAKDPLRGATEREQNQVEFTQIRYNPSHGSMTGVIAPMHWVLMCSSYLDTTRGKINIFSILSRSSLGNWKYFTSCKKKNNSHNIIRHKALKTWLMYMFPRRINPLLCHCVNDEFCFGFNI